MTQLWLIRAGREGERLQYNLEHGVAGGGFRLVASLEGCASREDVRAAVKAAEPNANDGRVNNFTGQLNSLRFRVEPGDIVAMPFKSEPVIAFGRVTGGYRYDASAADDACRHVVDVEWLQIDVARTALQQDLLYSLGAFITVAQIKRNDAEWRAEQIILTGRDPGSRTSLGGAPEAVEVVNDLVDDGATVGGVARDLARDARDQLAAVVQERFAGHGLADLVEAILQAQGFVTKQPDRGPDGGIDIWAGRGLLGLDSPKIVVQVKSGNESVDAPTVRQLNGVLATHGADQALLVAWGGLKKPAEAEVSNQRFSVRVWNADDVLAALTENYPKLPEEFRARLPLAQIWAVVPDGLQSEA